MHSVKVAGYRANGALERAAGRLDRAVGRTRRAHRPGSVRTADGGQVRTIRRVDRTTGALGRAFRGNARALGGLLAGAQRVLLRTVRPNLRTLGRNNTADGRSRRALRRNLRTVGLSARGRTQGDPAQRRTLRDDVARTHRPHDRALGVLGLRTNGRNPRADRVIGCLRTNGPADRAPGLLLRTVGRSLRAFGALQRADRGRSCGALRHHTGASRRHRDVRASGDPGEVPSRTNGGNARALGSLLRTHRRLGNRRTNRRHLRTGGRTERTLGRGDQRRAYGRGTRAGGEHLRTIRGPLRTIGRASRTHREPAHAGGHLRGTLGGDRRAGRELRCGRARGGLGRNRTDGGRVRRAGRRARRALGRVGGTLGRRFRADGGDPNAGRRRLRANRGKPRPAEGRLQFRGANRRLHRAGRRHRRTGRGHLETGGRLHRTGGRHRRGTDRRRTRDAHRGLPGTDGGRLRTNGRVGGKNRRLDKLVGLDHAQHPVGRRRKTGNLDEHQVLTLVKKTLGIRDRHPLLILGIPVLHVIVTGLGGLETELDHRRGGIFNLCSEIRLGSGLHPNESADTYAHHKDAA